MSTVADWHRRSLRELGGALREGALPARALLDHCLERIERINPALNALIFIDPKAKAAADASDARLRAGRAIGPLDGIPVAVKDNLLVREQPATWGSRLYADHVPRHDEIPIGLLRDNGAVIVGKTNVPEFTLKGYTANPLFGVTRNPWDVALTPGGSSGGSVAAIAAGLVPFAIGTDGGGSIRRPAGHTGLVGFKPTVGRIPRGRGFPAILLHCEVVGPLTRTVDDMRIAMGALAVPNRADPHSRALPPLSTQGEGSRRRLLFVETFGDAPVDQRIRMSFRQAAADFAALGHSVETGALPFSIEAATAVWSTIGNVGLALLARDEPRFFELASEEYCALARTGGAVGAAEYLGVIEVLNDLRARVGRAFMTVDAIVTPTAAAQPWPAAEVFPAIIDGEAVGPRGHAVFTGWVNACGHPAIAIPAQPAPDGMPIGIQLIGDFGADGLLLDLAAQYEGRSPWADRWPAIA